EGRPDQRDGQHHRHEEQPEALSRPEHVTNHGWILRFSLAGPSSSRRRAVAVTSYRYTRHPSDGSHDRLDDGAARGHRPPQRFRRTSDQHFHGGWGHGTARP